MTAIVRSSASLSAASLPFGASVVAAGLVLGGCGTRDELLATRAVPGLADAGALDAATANGAAGDGASLAPLRLVVAADGSGQFTTVQAAVDSVAKATVPVEIDIKAGTYDEKLTIAGPSFLTLVGDDPLTTILTHDDDATDAGSTAKSGSVTIHASDFSAKNLTFANSAPSTAAQAVALFVDGDRQQFLNCRFTSYQDTIYIQDGSQYFRDSYIEGDDDYILGASSAVFQSCTVNQDQGGVAVTAPNTPSTTAYGVVFFGGALTASSSVSPNSVALGRPWGPYGSTTFIGTTLGPHIAQVGWVPMGTNDLSQARFSEYATTGPGADPSMRASDSRQLTSAQAAGVTLQTVFGGWIPSFSQ
jgi:pectin methylesterase-like acyl-CoA thioesterase